MSAVSYKKIFSIKITHDYFSDLIDGSISLTLGLITQELKRRFDIHIHIFQNIYSVYINSEYETEEFLSHVESATSNHFFDFNIQVSNPNFYSYTDIFTDINSSLLYESNSLENTLDGNSIVLSAKPKSSIPTTTAAIKIYFQDILKNPSEGTTFLIAFNSRAIFLEYYIIPGKLDGYSNLYIDGSFSDFFEGPEHVTLPNDTVAVRFITKQPLKLNEVPKYKFQLFGVPTTASALSENFKMELPTADVRNAITNNENGNQKVLSSMYIYL